MAAAATAKIYHGNRAAIVAASASIPWMTTASFLPLGKRGIMMRELKLKRTRLASSSGSGPPSSSSSSSSSSPRGGGVYSAQEQLLELTAENVDRVLEEVRPYLIADGGNVEVDSVENGVVSLELQGACGSCVSSTTTMKMGIERVLKEKFGDAVKQVCQVGYEDQMPPNGITVEAVNAHLDILRPAIQNYGGIVQVISVEGGHCVVQYTGPESIGSGIKAAIKEKFPVLVDVVLTAAAA